MKQLGASKLNFLTVLLAVLLLASCSGIHPYSKYNVLVKDWYKYLLNDSLKIGFLYLCDNETVQSPHLDKTAEEIVRNIPLSNLIEQLKHSTLFLVNTSLYDLNYETHSFFFALNDTISTAQLSKADFLAKSMKEVSFYEKTFIPPSQNYSAYQAYIALNKNSLFIIAYIKNKYPFVGIEQRLNSLQSEYRDIIASLKYGSDYQSFLNSIPFDVANTAFNNRVQGGYADAVNALLKFEKKYIESPERAIYLQAIITYLSFLNDETRRNFYKNKLFYGNTKPSLYQIDSLAIQRDSLELISAKEYILRAAEKEQVIMFNESLCSSHNCNKLGKD
jgi:hypothetical protein